MKIEKGHRIKIDGESGSGKTTMLYKIAACLTERSIAIGFVEQNPIFFAGTVSENISLIDKNIDLDQIKKWMIALRLDENFDMPIESLINFELRDDGITLSGGQRKKIALVRELIRKPSILIIDELFAGLDPVSISVVGKFLHDVAKDIPIIFTSHTDDSLIEYDKALIMENLRLVKTV